MDYSAHILNFNPVKPEKKSCFLYNKVVCIT